MISPERRPDRRESSTTRALDPLRPPGLSGASATRGDASAEQKLVRHNPAPLVLDACPSFLDLERYAIGLAPRVGHHTSLCAKCQARIAEMELSSHLFLTEVYPATRERVLDAAEREFQRQRSTPAQTGSTRGPASHLA